MKWHIGRPSEYGTFSGSQVYDENNNGICQMYRLPLNVTLEEIEAESDVYGDALANAYLIAAAPELLDMLEEICDTISFDPNLYNLIGKERYHRVRTIIARAKGQA